MYKSYDFDHMPWFLVPVTPETEASVRRSTAVATWILAILMLSLLCVALAPQSSRAASAARQAPPQHKVQLKPNRQATAVALPHHV
jgi:hypothetical protein